ncbi:MAG TPA: iron-containing alcohol dehydrogenase, partial [Epsilonproteobacteria bacterium]|nr:iron-containing alcohol dehydrogenase [Campylobacterota bacterium]
MIVPIELVNTSNIKYDITIDALPSLHFDTNVVIVTNPTVSGYHLQTLLKKISATTLNVVTIPDGEEYKTLETVENILNACFEHKLDRKSLLIAFGGGVIGDMTGFTASLYQRGIDFIQIPTTLLSQVDASVGGKTGVNNKYGKNLIGAFYQPNAVYIDPLFLETLPPREFAAGVAEVVKMAVMFDKDFFHYLQGADLNNVDTIKEMIAK